MELMLVTLDTFQALRSEVKLLAPSNMELMLVTRDTSQALRSEMKLLA